MTSVEARDLREYLSAEITRIHDSRESDVRRLDREAGRLRDERLKLLQAHYAGAIPIELMKQEQQRISGQLEVIERKLARMQSQTGRLLDNLDRAL